MPSVGAVAVSSALLIRLVLLHAIGVALDVLLLRAGDPERALGHVPGDHRTGPSVRPIPDVTGATKEVWMPVFTPSPIVVRCFLRPS